MSYSLNGIQLSTFGFVAGGDGTSNIALSGFLDMPARLGKTHHVWAESKSVQPYVNQSEIKFGGRDLKLTGYIKGNDRQDCLLKSKAMNSLVDGFTGLVPLSSTDWGTFNVFVKSIKCELINETILSMVIEMREPVVDLSGTLPSPDGGDFGIDNHSFDQLGGFLTKFGGERYGRPGIKEQHFSAWGFEGFQITKAEAAELDMELFVHAANYVLFEAKIRALYKLFGMAGTRLMNVARDEFREFFVADGFATTNLYSDDDGVRAVVAFKAIQVNSEFYFITSNSGDFITDNSNNKILIR